MEKIHNKETEIVQIIQFLKAIELTTLKCKPILLNSFR